MDDQRRVFVAIALTLAIFFGWQALVKYIRPPLPESTSTAAGEPNAGVASAPATGQQGLSPSTLSAAPGGAAQPSLAQTPASESTVAFASPLFSGELGDRGGLRQLLLQHYREARAKPGELEPVSLVTAPLADVDRQALVTVTVGGTAVPLSYVERGPQRFVLAGASGATQATLTVDLLPSQYALGYDLKVENKGDTAVNVASDVSMGLAPNPTAPAPSFMAPAADTISGLCSVDGSVKRLAAKNLEGDGKSFAGAAWAGLDRQYFVVALVPDGGGSECRLSTRNANVFVDYVLGNATVAPAQSWNKQFVLYVGPKREADLKAVAPILANVIDYNIWGIPLGFLARPMVVVLNFFHSWSGSWGIAIILLTFLVKALLFPVTYKSVVSMRRMSLVRPEIEKLKERFGNDRERMQLEQVKLFREKGINPLGGCLPMLLQMPVWFALYRTLWTAVDLYQQKFLWLGDLTSKEHFPFLAIAFGLLTMLQQKLTPSTMDSQQAKIMMYVMPVVFSFFMISLPSGLVLYIVVNSILTIIQQLVINRRKVTL